MDEVTFLIHQFQTNFENPTKQKTHLIKISHLLDKPDDFWPFDKAVL